MPISKRKSRAKTPQQQENILISLANKLAEEKLRDGTASSQLICQVLMLGSERKKLENEKLKSDIEVANAKIKQLEQASVSGELYKKAIQAFQRYSGQEVTEFDDFEEDEGYGED